MAKSSSRRINEAYEKATKAEVLFLVEECNLVEYIAEEVGTSVGEVRRIIEKEDRRLYKENRQRRQIEAARQRYKNIYKN